MNEPIFDPPGASPVQPQQANLPSLQNPPSPRLPPPGAPYPDALMPQTNPWAIVSLASSILAWCGLFGIGGLIGVITGVIARNEILTSHGTQSGEDLAIVGIILGALNVVITCLFALCVSSLLSFLFV
ncbi:MAG: hypothetical protein KatS3mg053_4046 [Candidatus Roseilinea sp.]|nr:MAG: hypothetical protein KatS3mg053_4046 [Candidatus Roseilinea sp.]